MILKRIAAAALPLFLAVQFAGGIYLAESTLHLQRKPISEAAAAKAADLAHSRNGVLESVEIPAADAELLRAWYFRARTGNGNSVILLHGQGDNRAGMLAYAALLLSHGFDVLAPDSRAHGESGGAIATYGLVERDDVRLWVAWLRTRQSGSIFGLGESMGAAILLQSINAESGFAAVIAESSYCSFREIAFDRVGQFFGAGAWLGRTLLRPMVEASFVYARFQYGTDFTRNAPEKALAASPIPVLLIHGELDTSIPPRHSEILSRVRADIPLWRVPAARHCAGITSRPAEFERRVLAWFHPRAK